MPFGRTEDECGIVRESFGFDHFARLNADFADYGLAWMLRDYRGKKLVGHTGAVQGFVSRVMLVPGENLGVVVLTNAESNGAFDAILFHVLDYYFHAPKSDWVQAFSAAEQQTLAASNAITEKQTAERVASSKPALSLEKYAGIYHDPWYGPATIRFENGGLIFTLDHTPAAVADLQHWQFDTFKATWKDRTIEDAFLTFSLRPDGQIDHLTLQAVSPLADFSFDYQDLFFTPAGKDDKQRP